jgi:hypothetical protein
MTAIAVTTPLSRLRGPRLAAAIALGTIVVAGFLFLLLGGVGDYGARYAFACSIGAQQQE